MSWRVELRILSWYSISILWLNLNTWVEHLDLTWILESRILTWIESWQVEYLTRTQVLNLTQSVYERLSLTRLESWHFLSLNLIKQNYLSSATSAKSWDICSRIILRTRSILLHFMHSFFVYMKSSFWRIKRMRKCLSRIMRQKTKDFHQRCDERCVNFFNNKHVK